MLRGRRTEYRNSMFGGGIHSALYPQWLTVVWSKWKGSNLRRILFALLRNLTTTSMLLSNHVLTTPHLDIFLYTIKRKLPALFEQRFTNPDASSPLYALVTKRPSNIPLLNQLFNFGYSIVLYTTSYCTQYCTLFNLPPQELS